MVEDAAFTKDKDRPGMLTLLVGDVPNAGAGQDGAGLRLGGIDQVVAAATVAQRTA